MRQLYRHEHPPEKVEDLPSYLTRELSRIEQALSGLDPAASLKWQNMHISLISDTGAPAFQTFKGNTKLRWFSASDALHFSVLLPSDYLHGSTLKPHLNWVTTSTASTVNQVIWALDYTLAAPSATYGATTTLLATSTAGVIDQHIQLTLGDITATAALINSVLVGRLHRSGGNYAGKAGLLSFSIGYQADDIGSKTELIK